VQASIRIVEHGGGRDGLLVTYPLRGLAHARAFSFTDQPF
jgi:hypothetical protein